jgi:hypothetical protein
MLQTARELCLLRIAYTAIQMVGIKSLLNMNHHKTHVGWLLLL